MTDTDKLKRLAEATEGAIYFGDIRGRAMDQFKRACTPQSILALIAENERLEESLLNMKMVGDALLSGLPPREAAEILHGEYFARIDAAE